MPKSVLAETRITQKGFINTSDERITPTRLHQLYEELRDKQKRLAGLIYFQKDLEGRYP